MNSQKLLLKNDRKSYSNAIKNIKTTKESKATFMVN